MASDLALDKDITFDAEACTTAFSTAFRSWHWLTSPVSQAARATAESRLCLLHFLTPDRAALAAVQAADASSGPVALSHLSDDKYQLEAARSSTMYSRGRLSCGRDAYQMVLNFRCVLLVVIANLGQSLLLIKLLEYCRLLTDRPGQLWLDYHRANPSIVPHLFQNLQHILHAFVDVARQPDLRIALKNGTPVSPINYSIAISVADPLIVALRSAIQGNSLGDFRDIPVCATWFTTAATETKGRDRPTSTSTPTRGNTGTGSTTVTPDAKRTKLGNDQIERNKSNGILTYDVQASNNPKLPPCTVYGPTEKGGQERLCMQFCTRGYYCTRRPCPFPHITSLSQLKGNQEKELIKFVKLQPGLAFAEGKGPAGTKTVRIT